MLATLAQTWWHRPDSPTRVVLDVTRRCNLRCAMCRTWALPRSTELDAAEIGAVMIYGTNTLPPTPPVLFTVFGIGAAFFGLFLWARRNPFPAAVVGLVLFVSVHLFEAVMDPHSLYRGLIMKAIVIVVLARAVSQTGRYRQLLRSSAGR